VIEGSLVFDREEAYRIKREHFGTNYGEFKNVIEPFNILIDTNLQFNSNNLIKYNRFLYYITIIIINA